MGLMIKAFGLSLLLAVTACGQSGALYLPKTPKKPYAQMPAQSQDQEELTHEATSPFL